MSAKRTIERLWRDAVAAGRPTPAYLVQHGDEWRPLSWTEAAERVEGYANGLLVARRPQGRRVRDPRHEQGRVGALRLRARVDRRDRRPDLRKQLDQGRRLHPRSLRVGRRPLRGRGAAREGRRGARRDPAPPARPDVRGSRRPGRSRPRLRNRASGRAPRSARRDRGGRPLHLHLHLGHDRPAEGLHDLAPQLLRDGRGRRRPAELHRPRGHDAPLPPARAQLRAPDAPLRRLRRLRDRVPARPAAGGGRVADREADRLPERAARLREDPHRGRRQVRRDDGREAASSSTGRSASAAASVRSAAPASRSRAGSRPSTGSPTSSSTRR